MPTACMSLFDERGKIGLFGSPVDATSTPSASSTATDPRWKPFDEPGPDHLGDHVATCVSHAATLSHHPIVA